MSTTYGIGVQQVEANAAKAAVESPERTISLAETKGMLRRIATAEIEFHGEYFCTVEGVRTRVIA